MTALPRVAVLGLGIMGTAYARNLLKKGFAVAGFDPLSAARDSLKKDGGTPYDTPHAAAQTADVILCALPSEQALQDVMAGLRPVLKERHTLAEMGTLSLAAKEAAKQVAAACGAILLDCPVSGTGAQAASGDLVVFASGDAEGFQRLRPAFDAIARDVRLVGPFGDGMKLKYVANLLVSIHNLAAAEALMLAEKSSLDLNMVFDAVKSGAGNSRMFEVRGPLMINGRYEPATMKMDVYQKDLALIMDHARAIGCPVPLMAATLPYYSAAIAQGRHKQDTASLFAVLRQLAKEVA